MTGTLRLAAILAFLAVAACSCVLADRTTVDPNTPEGTAALALDKKSEEADPRLGQKITYDSGYKRLHTVADDLSKMSGVKIASGKSKEDWHVRDIPVVVYVKDMPLGKLLRAIADATHTRVRSEKIRDDDPVKSYRIYRRSIEEIEIDTLLQKKRDAQLAEAGWQWDAMVAYGKSKELPDIPKSTWLIAKLIASLAPDAKDKLLNGDTVRFTAGNLAHASIIEELYTLFWQQERDNGGETRKAAATSPNSKDAEAAVLKVKLVDTNIGLIYSPLVYGEWFSYWQSSLHEARSLEGKGLDLPPYPKEFTVPGRKEDMDNSDMAPLSLERGWGAKCPLLWTKFDLDMPKDIKAPTFADVIRIAASASGCNIVTEDFTSHNDPEYQKLGYLSTKQTDLGHTLLQMWPYGLQGNVRYTWFVDERDKLFVGWANDARDGQRTWRDRHSDLLPEKYITDLKNKLDGPGAELDDVIHLVNISKGSFDEWIAHSKDLPFLDQMQSSIDAVWQLYDSLKQEDRLLAKSEAGLPLARFDPEWIAGFFNAQKRAQGLSQETHSSIRVDKPQDLVERALNERAMSDPHVISTMMMRVVKSPATHRWEPGRGLAKAPSALKFSQYSIVIDCRLDDNDHKMTIFNPGGCAFPIRSRARETEMIKAAGARDQDSKKEQAVTDK